MLKVRDINHGFYKTRNILKIKVPFLSVFARILEEHNLVKSNDKPTHATDGKRYYYNEAFSKTLTADEFTFINMHEVYHVLFQHPIRGRNKDPNIYNMAADFKINSHLHKERNEYRAVTSGLLSYKMPNKGLIPRDYDGDVDDEQVDRLVRMDTEEIYLELLEKCKNKKTGAKINAYGNKFTVGEPIIGGIIFNKKTEAEHDADMRQATADLINAKRLGKTVGNMPGFLEAIAVKLTDVKIKWYNAFERKLKHLTAGECSLNTPLRWSVQTRNYLPGEEKDKPAQHNVHVGIDTSGSISNEELNKFFSTLHKLSKRYKVERNCHLHGWDTRVSERYNLKTALENFKQNKASFNFRRGGTEVNCYFEYLNKQRQQPDLIMVLTDGDLWEEECKLKKSLRSKVLWVLTGEYDEIIKKMGFGKVVYV